MKCIHTLQLTSASKIDANSELVPSSHYYGVKYISTAIHLNNYRKM